MCENVVVLLEEAKQCYTVCVLEGLGLLLEEVAFLAIADNAYCDMGCMRDAVE